MDIGTCDGCRQGFALNGDGNHIYMDVMTREYVTEPCTAQVEIRDDLNAKRAEH